MYIKVRFEEIGKTDYSTLSFRHFSFYLKYFIQIKFLVILPKLYFLEWMQLDFL